MDENIGEVGRVNFNKIYGSGDPQQFLQILSGIFHRKMVSLLGFLNFPDKG